MASVGVNIKSIDVGNFTKTHLETIGTLSEKHIETLARETEIIIKNKIQESITRANSTGKLQNAFFAEKSLVGWGVGDIDFLNEFVPYWRHVNFGSQGIGASHNHRVPTGAFNPGESQPAPGRFGQRWEIDAGNFSFIPTRPIEPLNYIAKTLTEIPRLISRVTGSIKL